MGIFGRTTFPALFCGTECNLPFDPELLLSNNVSLSFNSDDMHAAFIRGLKDASRASQDKVHIFKSLYNIKPLIKICSAILILIWDVSERLKRRVRKICSLGRSKRQVQLLFGLGEMLYVRIREKVALWVVGLCLCMFFNGFEVSHEWL